MKRVLVTGVNGFVGHHLARELHTQNIEVLGTGMDDALLTELEPYVDEFVPNCDLTDASAVAELPLDTVSAVINLAGLAQAGASEDKADLYNRVNVGVHTAVADRLRELGRTDTRVLAVSSGAVYDNFQPMPVNEESSVIEDGSPYVLSKIAMEKALAEYNDLDLVIVRPFNHIGPGQLGGFLVPDLVQQVMGGDTIVAGDLTTERDYTDVRDVVKAYVALVTAPSLKHRLYNVCSGKSVRGEKILEVIKAAAGKPNVKVKVDRSRIRKHDPKRIIGDNTRLREETGWAPSTPLEQTIQDIITST